MIQLAATELVSGVSGDTEEKIRQLFVIAKQSAPCVLVGLSAVMDGAVRWLVIYWSLYLTRCFAIIDWRLLSFFVFGFVV